MVFVSAVMFVFVLGHIVGYSLELWFVGGGFGLLKFGSCIIVFAQYNERGVMQAPAEVSHKYSACLK